MKTLNQKKSREGGEEFTIIRLLYELQELFVRLSVLGLNGRKKDPKVLQKGHPLSLEEKVDLYQTDLCA